MTVKDKSEEKPTEGAFTVSPAHPLRRQEKHALTAGDIH